MRLFPQWRARARVTAFFDITGQKGNIYVFESGELRETLPFELVEEMRFQVGELPGDIEDAFVSLPLEMLDFRMVELPISDPERLREVLPFELDGLILGGTEGVAMDAVVAEKTEERHMVLAAYMDKARLSLLLERLREINMDPRAVTCLELGHIIKKSSGEPGSLGRMLTEAPAIDEAERPYWAIEETGNCTINLRRGDMAYTKDLDRLWRSMRFVAAGLIALLVIISVDIAVRTVGAKKEIARVEDGIIKTYAAIFPGEKPGRAQGLVYKMKARMKEAREKDALLTRVSPLEFLMALREIRPTGVVFTEITLEREFVVLNGEAPSLSDVEQVKTRLEGLFREVRISNTGQSVKGGVAFTITAKEGGG